MTRAHPFPVLASVLLAAGLMAACSADSEGTSPSGSGGSAHVHDHDHAHPPGSGGGTHDHADGGSHPHLDGGAHGHADGGGHRHDGGHSHLPDPVRDAGGPQIIEDPNGDYVWNLPAGFPLPDVPEDNPMTAAKVELGRHLFYDTRLSGNGTQSCASCHHQELAFSDGLRTSTGSTGEVGKRNSPSLANVAYASTLTWINPHILTLEAQIPIPMFGELPVELGIAGHEDEVLERFRATALYDELFEAAFPEADDPYTFPHVIKAIASFVRTMITGDSPYDRYIYGGDAEALSESAKRGLALFFEEELECHHCHNGFNFTNATWTAKSAFRELAFFNTGLYNVGGSGLYPTEDTGLFEFTGDEKDDGKFRTPSLRNVALTAPYFHDGSAATLREALDVYRDGGRQVASGPYAGDGRDNPNKDGFVHGFEITDAEMDDLIAFLESLTDEQFLSDPRFSNPFE